MTGQDIVDTIAEVLRQAEVRPVVQSPSGRAAAVLSALRAAGYAVVELPDDVDSLLRHYDLEVIPRDDGVPPIQERGGWALRYFTPSEARRRAAALLAAADKAEEGK